MLKSKFLKPSSTTNLPKSPIFLGNFYKGAKIFNFSIEIMFEQLLPIFSGHTAQMEYIC